MNFFDEDFDNFDKFVEDIGLAEKDIYHQHGYKNRDEYLHSLARDYDIPYEVVRITASVYGPNEDFDGLVSAIEDLTAFYPYDATDENKNFTTNFLAAMADRYSRLDDADDDF